MPRTYPQPSLVVDNRMLSAEGTKDGAEKHRMPILKATLLPEMMRILAGLPSTRIAKYTVARMRCDIP